MSFLTVLSVCPLVLAQSEFATQGENVPAYYDTRNGNLTIDASMVAEGKVIGYGLAARGLVGDNHTPFLNSAFVTSTDTTIGESNFAGVPGGIYSLGNVLPAGLTSEDRVYGYRGRGSWGVYCVSVIHIYEYMRPGWNTYTADPTGHYAVS